MWDHMGMLPESYTNKKTINPLKWSNMSRFKWNLVYFEYSPFLDKPIGLLFPLWGRSTMTTCLGRLETTIWLRDPPKQAPRGDPGCAVCRWFGGCLLIFCHLSTKKMKNGKTLGQCLDFLGTLIKISSNFKKMDPSPRLKGFQSWSYFIMVPSWFFGSTGWMATSSN